MEDQIKGTQSRIVALQKKREQIESELAKQTENLDKEIAELKRIQSLDFPAMVENVREFQNSIRALEDQLKGERIAFQKLLGDVARYGEQSGRFHSCSYCHQPYDFSQKWNPHEHDGQMGSTFHCPGGNGQYVKMEWFEALMK